MRIVFFSLAVAVAACGDGNSHQVDGPRPADAPPVIDSRVVDSPTGVDAADPRGPATLDLAGGANGLLWDDASSTLYVTDSNANTLLRFTDAGGIETVGTWPVGTVGISLGDLVKRPDGSILTANFGFGTEGTLFSMAADGTSSTALTGLSTSPRRIGLTQDSAGVLYNGYFVGMGMGMQNGGVSVITIVGTTATEVEIAGTTTTAGFKKVVGLAATTTAVFVSDQTVSTIYKIAIPGNVVSTVGTVPSADLLSIMPNGDLLTGGTGVHRLTQAGVATTIFPGSGIRGTAYDPTLRRLFYIEHSETPGTPDKLQIRPLDN